VPSVSCVNVDLWLSARVVAILDVPAVVAAAATAAAATAAAVVVIGISTIVTSVVAKHIHIQLRVQAHGSVGGRRGRRGCWRLPAEPQAVKLCPLVAPLSDLVTTSRELLIN
jgi:hypothetical protein